MSALSLLKQKLSQKASDSTDQQSVRIADGSAIAIIRMMASKAVDEGRIAALIDPKFADPALPDRMIGHQITYGDLKTKLDDFARVGVNQVSSTVGTSVSASSRCGLDTASARNWPALMGPTSAGRPVNISCSWPPSRSVTAGAVPR